MRGGPTVGESGVPRCRVAETKDDGSPKTVLWTRTGTLESRFLVLGPVGRPRHVDLSAAQRAPLRYKVPSKVP